MNNSTPLGAETSIIHIYGLGQSQTVFGDKPESSLSGLHTHLETALPPEQLHFQKAARKPHQPLALCAKTDAGCSEPTELTPLRLSLPVTSSQETKAGRD